MRMIDILNEFNKPENRKKWDAKAQGYFEDDEKMRKLVNEAMKKADHNKEEMEKEGHKKEVPSDYTAEKFLCMLDLAKDYAHDAYRVIPRESIQLIIVGLVYFVSENDIIMDDSSSGLVDDAAVLGFVIKKVNDDLEAYKVWKQQQ